MCTEFSLLYTAGWTKGTFVIFLINLEIEWLACNFFVKLSKSRVFQNVPTAHNDTHLHGVSCSFLTFIRLIRQFTTVDSGKLSFKLYEKIGFQAEIFTSHLSILPQTKTENRKNAHRNKSSETRIPRILRKRVGNEHGLAPRLKNLYAECNCWGCVDLKSKGFLD